MPQTEWLGKIPERCDVCKTPISVVFFDAKTEMGPWANLCVSCHTLGPGLGKVGPGLGQEYRKQPDGRWIKCAG